MRLENDRSKGNSKQRSHLTPRLASRIAQKSEMGSARMHEAGPNALGVTSHQFIRHKLQRLAEQ